MVRSCAAAFIFGVGMFLTAQSATRADMGTGGEEEFPKACQGATPNAQGNCPTTWTCAAGTCGKGVTFCNCDL